MQCIEFAYIYFALRWVQCPYMYMSRRASFFFLASGLMCRKSVIKSQHMWPQGKLEASEKTASDGVEPQRHWYGNSMLEMAQLGQFSENLGSRVALLPRIFFLSGKVLKKCKKNIGYKENCLICIKAWSQKSWIFPVSLEDFQTVTKTSG